MRQLSGSKASPDRAAGAGRLRFVVLSLLVGLVASCSSPPPPTATGPELYSELCSSCHGAGLEGGTGPRLGEGAPSTAEPDTYLETAIRRGVGKMPSFDYLSDGQIARLVTYLRDVQAGR